MGLEQGHRAGALKQSNKVHKTGRHRSKGTIDNDLKGKVAATTANRKQKALMRKEQRRHQANQIRKNKRDEVIAKKRSLGSGLNAPFLVCVLPLNEQVDPKSALEMLKKCDEEAVVYTSNTGTTHITIPRFKQHFSFICPAVGHGQELATLDCLKVCDTTLLLVSANAEEDDIYDRWGKRIVNMAVAQGIPTPVVSVMDLESIAPNRRSKVKANIQKLVHKSFPEEKILSLDTNGDALNILRRIGGQKKKVLYNRDNRPHMYSEDLAFLPNETDPALGTLKVTGYLRGVPLNVNGLVHIPGLGDFQLAQVDSVVDPFKANREVDGFDKILARPTESLQVSLDRENIPDEMDAEQTWPTEEEIAHAQAETKKTKLVKRVPKGMSDYQACWIPDVEEKDDDDDDDDDDMSDEEDDEDENFMSCESGESSEDEFEKQEEDEECDTVSVSVSEAPVNDEKYDLNMDLKEERETWEKIKEARTDQLWPDEIDTSLTENTRTRFQKYRGLESFRTSPWDVKENLPVDYAKIFQFKNFDRTKRRIIKEKEDNGDILPGWFIRIHVKNVPVSLWESFKSVQLSDGLIAYGLLPHEHQMSVVNAVLKRAPDSTIPIKSKERLIMQCGFRRYIINPVFSQHTNSDRHKYERYFRPGDTVVATFFAPIQFPPAPILCFQENPDTSLRLVANGMLLSCNPDRIILKRVVLSGHPYKINRRTATIRYMFQNKEDVDFFSPVKLRTRCGRHGHIKESLGTHGHMKCVFDGQLKSFDTIFLYLYKRVFPKWTYEDCIVANGSTGAIQDSEMNE